MPGGKFPGGWLTVKPRVQWFEWFHEYLLEVLTHIKRYSKDDVNAGIVLAESLHESMMARPLGVHVCPTCALASATM